MPYGDRKGLEVGERHTAILFRQLESRVKEVSAEGERVDGALARRRATFERTLGQLAAAAGRGSVSRQYLGSMRLLGRYQREFNEALGVLEEQRTRLQEERGASVVALSAVKARKDALAGLVADERQAREVVLEEAEAGDHHCQATRARGCFSQAEIGGEGGGQGGMPEGGATKPLKVKPRALCVEVLPAGSREVLPRESNSGDVNQESAGRPGHRGDGGGQKDEKLKSFIGSGQRSVRLDYAAEDGRRYDLLVAEDQCAALAVTLSSSERSNWLQRHGAEREISNILKSAGFAVKSVVVGGRHGCTR